MLFVVGSGPSGVAYTIKTIHKYLRNSMVGVGTKIKKEKKTELESET